MFAFTGEDFSIYHGYEGRGLEGRHNGNCRGVDRIGQSWKMESVDGLLVPKLCLGMPLSRQLCCHTGETEFRRQVRYQTEFGNEGLTARRRNYGSAPRSVLARTALAINRLFGYSAPMSVVSHDPKVLGGEPGVCGNACAGEEPLRSSGGGGFD
jgi:hypothetical protein